MAITSNRANRSKPETETDAASAAAALDQAKTRRTKWDLDLEAARTAVDAMRQIGGRAIYDEHGVRFVRLIDGEIAFRRSRIPTGPDRGHYPNDR